MAGEASQTGYQQSSIIAGKQRHARKTKPDRERPESSSIERQTRLNIAHWRPKHAPPPIARICRPSQSRPSLMIPSPSQYQSSSPIHLHRSDALIMPPQTQGRSQTKIGTGGSKGSQDPSEIRREGVFCCRTPSTEPAASRTRVDALHASLQAFLGNVHAPGCLLRSHY